MKQLSRRPDRSRTVAECLLSAMFLLLAPATVQAQPADTPHGDTPGSVWRLVRAGGGLVSPLGRTGLRLQSVAASDERFVAVGEQGTIAYSTDGNWWVAARSTATDDWLTDVAWGGGRFVAVGGYRIIYSSDGDRWERSRSGNMGRLESVAWGNDRFVAVGANGTIVHSGEGSRWRRLQNDATRTDLVGIAWGGGRFVALGRDGTIVYSTDGESWETATHTGGEWLSGVAWNGERFVAVGGTVEYRGSRAKVLYSIDGDRWQPARRLPAIAGTLEDIAWNGHRFVAVGDRSIVYSDDGERWQPATENTQNSLRAVAGNSYGFVALSWEGAVLYSTDGIVWSAGAGGGPLPDLDTVAWGADRFLAFDYWTCSIVHSLDGQDWKEMSCRERGFSPRDVIWDGDRFVAVSYYSIGHSGDGDRWQLAHTSYKEGPFHAVSWNGDRYVAVGFAGLIMHSGDGERWSRATDSATTETLNDVAWNGKRFVAVGRQGVIVNSSDGDRWRPAYGPAVLPACGSFGARDWQCQVTQPGAHRYSFEGIAWNGERFVAVGFDVSDRAGTIVHSKDGDHWELAADHDYLAAEHFAAVTWNGERFVAVGWDDRSVATIVYSSDGDRWDPADEIATFDPLNDVSWGGGRFVAVGSNGTIVTSP